ncbi:cysteine--tRNA ligase [Candidatus Karelsulcia muelleri]
MYNYKNSQIKIFNSLTGKKELFIPFFYGQIGIYVCGPTVYKPLHIGNCRTFIFFDILFRYFKYLGFKVKYIRNITDVGHLDLEEDKILKTALLEQIGPMEVVQKYSLEAHKSLKLFNTLSPNIEPTASGHLIEQIELIKSLILMDMAYVSNGSVYFNFNNFNKNFNLKVGFLDHNLSYQNYKSHTNYKCDDKKFVNDFVLWKKALHNNVLSWDSPWGKGFPGWHLECTAMSMKYLGNIFDIHGGGIDLKSPHHDCEIVQSTALNKNSSVKYWIHTNFINMNGKKMSKSNNNFLLPINIINGKTIYSKKKIDPMVIKFFVLKTHYRKVIDFSFFAIKEAEKNFDKIFEAYVILKNLTSCQTTSTFNVKKWIKHCFASINDDFNIPLLIKNLFKGISLIKQIKKGQEILSKKDILLFKKYINIFLFKILGLKKKKEVKNIKVEKIFSTLIEIRCLARNKKYWSISDKIREKLINYGFLIKDSKI